jgi:hypothetical protein
VYSVSTAAQVSTKRIHDDLDAHASLARTGRKVDDSTPRELRDRFDPIQRSDLVRVEALVRLGAAELEDPASNRVGFAPEDVGALKLLRLHGRRPPRMLEAK